MRASGSGDLNAGAAAHLRPFSPLIEHAIELSAQWHDRTYRKGRWREEPFAVGDDGSTRVPVMAHLTAVALTVARAQWDDVTIAAAFLHDALEDENQLGVRLRLEQLESAVGADVAHLVSLLTEEVVDASGAAVLWEVRKRRYLERLETAPDEAIAISAADKLHNLWSISSALEKGIDVFTSGSDRRALSAGPAAQRWFYRAVLDVVTRRHDARLVRLRSQLEEEVERFERLIDAYA